MTAKTNYVAKLDDQIIGTRSSARTYTHAVAIQYSEGWYRERANSVAYAKQHCTPKGFAYEQQQVSWGVDGMRREYSFMSAEEAARNVSDAQRIVDMGYDGWVAERLAKNIAEHNDRVERGGFKPGIATWCGRPDLAQKEAAKYERVAGVGKVWIVEAEQVAKLPKVAGERKHMGYGPHSS